jgi:ABC-type glycerol-3-phosphate transport system substrate-binding protein
LVNRFKEIYGRRIEVEVTSIPWGDYKQELSQVAIHQSKNFDVSQAGAPVVNDLLAMNALRPFTPREINDLGGERAFVPIAWKSCTRVLDGKVWAIPLFADPRAIVYWGDMLEKAGVEEETAFSSFDRMEETFQRLQANGVQNPWCLNLSDRFLLLHSACSWIWASGSDFVSPETHQTQFTTPAAIKGLKAYFGLKRYMPANTLKLAWREILEAFPQRQAAATIINLGEARNWYRHTSDELRPYLRVALPLGQAFVGGSSLLIWGHSTMGEHAFNLVRFLTSAEVQSSYPLQYGQLPVRQDLLDQPPFPVDPIYTGFAQVLKCGRIFPNIKLGGLLEDQLARSLESIWHTLFEDPTADIEATMLDFLNPLARRYDRMLG